MVRRTPAIDALLLSGIREEAAALVQGCDPQILARAVTYLYTKETKGTFAIEGETASGTKAERFVAALRSVRDFDPASEKDQTRLQNVIVDPRYAAAGWRDFQNFVGESSLGYDEIVHFICPKPEDVRPLMAGFAALTARLKGAEIDPVLAAAVIAFAFVFIHPFGDGNGRIHRYLIHHTLSEAGFTPPGVLFPVSAAIVRNQRAYDAALERFSRAIAPHIDWAWSNSNNGDGGGPDIVVRNRTDHLYRYFDATPQTEYLYGCVIDTVRQDLRNEVLFLEIFDRAMRGVMDRIDMPNRKAGQLVTLVLQNGRIGKDKRASLYSELTDAEIGDLERIILDARMPPANGE